MSQLKGNNVYVIMYNYSDCDYSIVKIMEKLEDAYNYICHQESNYTTNSELFKMVEVTKSIHLDQIITDDHLNVCYISSGKYNKFSLCNHENVSHYAIVPMVIS